ncbi:DNA cytosine methyltransferase [Streptomyces sp. IBSNAI002]|uniref:DNA cytosine methyltransferase n=1 Tax=Streptomyces sp. IBSNAI002 TaxID=3457500 RepID=UPI003FCEF084
MRPLGPRRPQVLDLFCGAGGAGMGYHRAGFDVVGCDLQPRPNYPFKFIEGDALDCFREIVQDFDLVHASPPCQSQCTLTKGTNQGRTYVNLIPEVRALCEWYGVPYVIENVPGSEVRRDIVLCGEMFGLGVIRHRQFEIGWYCATPKPVHRRHRGPVRGWRHGVYRDGPYIAAYGKGGGKGDVPEMQAALGIDWTDIHEELTEAIPPAYTQWIGEQWITLSQWGAHWRDCTNRCICPPMPGLTAA